MGRTSWPEPNDRLGTSFGGAFAALCACIVCADWSVSVEVMKRIELQQLAFPLPRRDRALCHFGRPTTISAFDIVCPTTRRSLTSRRDAREARLLASHASGSAENACGMFSLPAVSNSLPGPQPNIYGKHPRALPRGRPGNQLFEVLSMPARSALGATALS